MEGIMGNRGKYLAKNTFIFAVGNIATKFISFFLVPLYTSVLSTSQYGVVDLVNTMGNVLAPILIFNVSEAVLRFSLDKDADYDKIMSTGIIGLIIAVGIGLLLIPGCKIIADVAPYSIYIYFYILSLSASQLFLCYLRGKEKLVLYSIGNIIQSFLIAALNVVFLKFMNLGVTGYFIACISANFVAAIFAFIQGDVIHVIANFKFDRELTGAMMKYSIVLVPNTFMWWIMNSSDRIMVTSMIGAAANGIYAISYKLPSLVSTLTGIFNQAWGYSAIREEGSEDEKEYSNIIFIHLVSIVFLLSITLMTILKPFLRLYVHADYYEAWRYTPFLIIGSAYLTLATFVGTSYTVRKDSFGYLFSATFGAVLNIILNFCLIPTIKIYGASLATCISYVAVFLFRLFNTQKYMPYNICNKEFIGGSVLLLISGVTLFIDGVVGIVAQIVIFVASLFLFSKMWIPLIKSGLKKLFVNGK